MNDRMSMEELIDVLKYGPYAWPGGYPMYLLCDDGDAMCYECGAQCVREGETGDVVEREINWDQLLWCCNCGHRIETAYETDEEEE